MWAGTGRGDDLHDPTEAIDDRHDDGQPGFARSRTDAAEAEHDSWGVLLNHPDGCDSHHRADQEQDEHDQDDAAEEGTPGARCRCHRIARRVADCPSPSGAPKCAAMLATKASSCWPVEDGVPCARQDLVPRTGMRAQVPDDDVVRDDLVMLGFQNAHRSGISCEDGGEFGRVDRKPGFPTTSPGTRSSWSS